jgi:hypothetical protein
MTDCYAASGQWAAAVHVIGAALDELREVTSLSCLRAGEGDRHREASAN